MFTVNENLCDFETCCVLKKVVDCFGFVDAFSHILLGFLQLGVQTAKIFLGNGHQCVKVIFDGIGHFDAVIEGEWIG